MNKVRNIGIAAYVESKEIVLSKWIVIDGYCATRIIDGTDVNDVKNRVAFIEKTPSIRTSNGWESGPKGQGGSIEDEGEIIYGFYPPSREWCDKRLLELGYTLLN
jgi:hypothetical protein